MQTPPLPSDAMPHLIEAVALGVALVLKAAWDHRVQQKHTSTTRRERNEELDTRLKNVTHAIGMAQQSNELEFGKLNSRFDRMDGTVEAVASDVKGLKDRELARLETDAAPTRQRRKR